MINMTSKRGSVGSAFNWIVAFFIIFFIMFIYVLVLLAIIGIDIKDKSSINIEDGHIDLNLHSKFLSFLDSIITVNSREEKIIDAIRFSLEPYFNIRNSNGESFVELFGLKALTENQRELRDKMDVLGFDQNDWNEYLQASSDFQENRANEIMEKLEILCNIDKNNNYFLELPQGIITRDGLKLKETFRENDYFDYKKIIFNTNYQGENIEIKFWLDRECQ